MTEKLKTLMDESAEVQFAAPDLDAIVTAGDRTVRRRRVGVGAAGLAAAAVVAGGVVALVGGDDGRTVVADGPAPLTGITWASDGALHTPEGAAYDVGHPIAAYVRTTEGYAFTDGEGSVFSFIDGTVRRIGTISPDHPRLVSDSEGSLVGWVDPRGPGFVVVDLATGQESRFGMADPDMGELADEADPFYFYAIDGRTAYVRDSRGAIAVGIDDDQVRVIDADARNGFDIGGVANGLVAFSGGQSLKIGRTPEDATVIPGTWGSDVAFSPDARWVSIDADEPMVFDVRTGEQVRMDVGGRPFATGFEWLDDHTLVMAASPKMVGPLQLLTCQVPAGTCEVSVPDLGMFDDIEGKIAVANGITTE